MYSTTISSDLIGRPELEALVATPQKSTGKAIQLQEQYVVETDDINITCMIDSLRDTLRGPVKAKVHRHKVKAVKEPKKAKTKDGTRSVKNVESGEVISTRMFKQLVKAGQIQPNVLFEDGKGIRFTVVDHQLIKEPKS